jgi:predicted nucleic acid-binding protein
MRIDLDNCCYNRPFDKVADGMVKLEAVAKMSIQQLVKDREIELVISFVSVFENNANPYEEKRLSIANFFQYASEFCGSEKQEQIGILTEKIIDTGIKEADALHVACAIVSKCDYFITTDKRLLKYRSPEIIVINPINFLMKWREQEQ